jgi:hypothetical protein
MRNRIMAITIATLLLAAAARAQSVTYDMDRTAPFATFKTYAWVRGTEVADDWNDKRVISAVNMQLALRGMLRVDATQHPDVLVRYHAAFDRKVQISGSASGPFLFPAGRTGTARAEGILVGTLAVDVIEARTKRIVWRGVASKDIDVTADPARREKSINRTAEKLFKKYPAGK